MSWTVPFALYGFLPLSLVFFFIMPPRRAVMATLLGFLFLPMAGYSFSGLPDYNKETAVSLALVLGVLMLDPGRLRRLQLRWFDGPMVLWCLVPLASSMSNHLGLYDGLTAVFGRTLSWGVPYFIGRLYFGDWEGVRALAIGILIGGLLYVPLCLYEIRMSPQLHTMVYGYHQHVFYQSFRLGGWRPTVFLQHGIAVGMWMTAVSIAGIAVWREGRVRVIAGVPTVVPLVILLVTTVLCKSIGSMVLLFFGIGVWISCRVMKSVIPLAIVAALVPCYLFSRVAFDWRAEPVINLLENLGVSRTNSLEGRIAADARIKDRALKQPVFGWGGWDRFRKGEAKVLPDTLWSISFGQNGLVGLSSLFASLLLPVALVLIRLRRSRLDLRLASSAIGLAMVLVLFSYDCLSNAMVNPMFTVAAGALVAWIPLRTSARASAMPTNSATSVPQSV